MLVYDLVFTCIILQGIYKITGTCQDRAGTGSDNYVNIQNHYRCLFNFSFYLSLFSLSLFLSLSLSPSPSLPPFILSLSLSHSSTAQIIVDNHLRSVSDPKGCIYALGDCAHVQGQPMPCTAQAAERQGRYLAQALTDVATKKEEPKPFVFKPWGMLAYVGGYKAIHDLPVDKSQGTCLSRALWRRKEFGCYG